MPTTNETVALTLRIPAGMHEELRRLAFKNRTSVTHEIITRIRKGMITPTDYCKGVTKMAYPAPISEEGLDEVSGEAATAVSPTDSTRQEKSALESLAAYQRRLAEWEKAR